MPDGCTSFDGYTVTREDSTVEVTISNEVPGSMDLTCAMVYGFVETIIPLGSDFESGRTYTLVVNDVTQSLVAQ